MSDGCTHTVEKLRDLTHELQILYIFVLKYGDAMLYFVYIYMHPSSINLEYKS